MKEHRTKSTKKLGSIISETVDWPVLAGACAVLLLVAAACGRQKITHLLLAMLVASVIAGVAANGIKSVAGRTRPSNKEVAQGWYGMQHEGEWIVTRNKFNSFPSSHTACAASIFGMLWVLGRGPGVLSLVAVFLVMWARMAVGAHHFSDTVAAACIGFAVAWWTWRGPLPLAKWTERFITWWRAKLGLR